MNLRIRSLALGITLGAMIAGAPAAMAASPAYQVRNLVSDVPGSSRAHRPEPRQRLGSRLQPVRLRLGRGQWHRRGHPVRRRRQSPVPGRLHPRRSPDGHRVQRVERLRGLQGRGVGSGPLHLRDGSGDHRGVGAERRSHPRHHGRRQLGVRSHLQGPGARQRRHPVPDLRHRLPQREDRRLRQGLQPRELARRLRGLDPGQVRAIRHPGHRAAAST